MTRHTLMKTALVLIPCTTFAIVSTAIEPSSTQHPTATKPTPEETAVRAVLDAQVTAWNKADIDGFMAGYWKDEKLTFISGGDITKGWEPTRERYIKKYQADGKDKMGKLSFNELHVEILSPAAAMVHGRFELVRGEKTDWGRFTLAFRKLPEGWKIIHDHTSVPPVEKK
ncbi:MAG TPA: nuclear transport factor 2 family protein [Gemmata sp.]|jgi:ketosteroid isomerase-like protein|nr:nuclear transport factor 2 family protein [Gemmata sp.]